MAKILSFVGTWETNWVSIDTGPHTGLLLTVTESTRSAPSSGQVLDGMWDAPDGQPGTLYGKLIRDQWTGDWKGPDGGGTFSFKLDAKGNHFTGSYTVEQPRKRETNPAWDGRLMRKHVPV